MKIILSKTIDEVRKEISSRKVGGKDKPTHLLSCRHSLNTISGIDYFMRCEILKKMPGQRVKILVYGDRYWKHNKDKVYIRYVNSSRVEPIKLKPNIKKGDRVSFVDKRGALITGSMRIREIYCGKKGCTKCPHKIYAYVRYREGKKVKDKYIGVAR